MNAEAWKHLARAYHGVGDKAKAADAAQRYAALKPADAGGHYNAGVLLAQFGQREAAERAFRAALAVDPGHAKARQALYKLTEEAPAAARPTAPAAARERRGMPWQAKVAAALTLLACLAIVIALFLPGGPANRGPKKHAPEPSPSAVTTPPADQPNADTASIERAPQPTDQAQVQPQTQGPPRLAEPPKAPQTQTLAPPTGDTRARDQQIQQLQSQLRQLHAMYQAQPREGASAKSGVAGTSQGPGGQATPAGGPAGPSEAPSKTEPTAPKPPQGLPASTAAPAPAPAAAPAPQARPPLFTPDRARRIADDIDRIETYQARQGIWYLAWCLANDRNLQREDMWEFEREMIVLLVAETSPSAGTLDLADIVQTSGTCGEAAYRISQRAYDLESVLPEAVKRQIANSLATSVSAGEAWRQVDAALRAGGTGTTEYTAEQLRQTLVKAEQERMKVARGRAGAG
jgi:hypothetical protein